MDPDEVVGAVERGWTEFGHPKMPDEMYKILDRAKGKERRLKLK